MSVQKGDARPLFIQELEKIYVKKHRCFVRKQRAYRYNKKNRERQLLYSREYYAKKKGKILKRQKKNKELKKEYIKEYKAPINKPDEDEELLEYLLNSD
ncbi:MAG: hypothetical protein ACXAAH_16455 [Promethearchaeota archaeon]